MAKLTTSSCSVTVWAPREAIRFIGAIKTNRLASHGFICSVQSWKSHLRPRSSFLVRLENPTSYIISALTSKTSMGIRDSRWPAALTRNSSSFLWGIRASVCIITLLSLILCQWCMWSWTCLSSASSWPAQVVYSMFSLAYASCYSDHASSTNWRSRRPLLSSREKSFAMSILWRPAQTFQRRTLIWIVRKTAWSLLRKKSFGVIPLFASTSFSTESATARTRCRFCDMKTKSWKKSFRTCKLNSNNLRNLLLASAKK